MQKKNMISIFVCMLLIAVSISSVTGTIDENETLNMKNDDYTNLIKQAIESGIISNNDWLEQDKLLASDGAAYDFFGYSVSISGDYAIIGSPYDCDNGLYSGSAYVFKRYGTAWTEQDKLLASDAAEDDLFGYSVSIDGDYAIIGAPYDCDNGSESGSAYVFTKDDGGNQSDLDCYGNLEWPGVTPGSIVTGSFTVENIGDPSSLLDWEVESYPDWGDWSFDPDGGDDLLAGDTVTIDVEVIAPDEPEETFTGEVVLVNSEDPDDTCTISVSLATPVNQFQSNQQIPRFLQSIIERYPILRQVLGL